MAPNNKRVRRRPTAGTTATAAMALVALASSSSSPSSFARAASHGRPPSIKKAPNHKNKRPSKLRGASMADAAVAAGGFFLATDGSDTGNSNGSGGSNGNGDSNSGRVMVVQPDNLQGTAHVGSSTRYQQSQGASSSQSGGAAVQQQQRQQQQQGNVQLHPWPHPDTFQDDAQQQQQQGQRNMGSDWAGDRALYGRALHRGGHPVEYYANGVPMQASSTNSASGSSSTNRNVDMDGQAGLETWIKAQQEQNGGNMQSSGSGGMHVAKYNYYSKEQPDHPAPARGQSDSNIDINYETWLENRNQYQQQQGQARGASSSSSSSNQMDFDTWLANQGNTQVQQQAQGGTAPTDYQAWLDNRANTQAQQQAQGEAAPKQVQQAPQGGSSQTDYHTWLENRGMSTSSLSFEDWFANQQAKGQQKMQAQGASQPSLVEDLDVVAGKQIILRPRLNNVAVENLGEMKLSLPPMGSTSQTNNDEGADTSNSNNGGDSQPVVYYYDPQALQSSNNNGNNELESAPELSLPEIVYDSSGRALKLEQVHAGGRNEVFLEVKPKAVWGSDFSSLNDRLQNFAVEHKLAFNPLNGNGSSANGAQSQDQLIVLFTVATMAVMVGALSAKRLRSKKLLESCMHPELDEDWEIEEFGSVAPTPRYDKKFDVDTGRSVASSTVGGSGGSSGSSSGVLNSSTGFGALMGGRNSKGAAGYYGTNDSGGGGGLHWRGDMEKFDV